MAERDIQDLAIGEKRLLLHFGSIIVAA